MQSKWKCLRVYAAGLSLMTTVAAYTREFQAPYFYKALSHTLSPSFSNWVIGVHTIVHPRLFPKSWAVYQVTNSMADVIKEVDVVVIGSIIGGLCCAAMEATCGFNVTCLEAHDLPGGCERYSSASRRVPFRFDSGPSLGKSGEACGIK